MLFSFSNNTIKIDNNDHYFTGIVDVESFPQMIKDNYEDIINKSFENYSDDVMSVTNDFDGNIYVINFSFNMKPLSFKSSISVPMIKNMKDFKDYMNERMEKLEQEIVRLNLKVHELSESKVNNMIDEVLQSDNEEEQDDESIESEEEEIEVKVTQKNVKKGGKQDLTTRKVPVKGLPAARKY